MIYVSYLQASGSKKLQGNRNGMIEGKGMEPESRKEKQESIEMKGEEVATAVLYGFGHLAEADLIRGFPRIRIFELVCQPGQT